MRRIDLGGAASFAVSSGLPEIAEVFVVEEMAAADVVDDEKMEMKWTIRANLWINGTNANTQLSLFRLSENPPPPPPEKLPNYSIYAFSFYRIFLFLTQNLCSQRNVISHMVTRILYTVFTVSVFSRSVTNPVKSPIYIVSGENIAHMLFAKDSTHFLAVIFVSCSKSAWFD